MRARFGSEGDSVEAQVTGRVGGQRRSPVRPAPAAVVGFVYLLPFEGIFSAVVKGSERWLPGQVLSAVSEGGTGSVTFSHALAMATAYTVIAAAALFAQRDVTA